MTRLLLLAVVLMLAGCASAPRSAEEDAAHKADVEKVRALCRSLGLEPKSDAYARCYATNLLVRGL